MEAVAASGNPPGKTAVSSGSNRTELLLYFLMVLSGAAYFVWTGFYTRLFSVVDLDGFWAAGRVLNAGGNPYLPAAIAATHPGPIIPYYVYPPYVGPLFQLGALLSRGEMWLLWNTLSAIFAAIPLYLLAVRFCLPAKRSALLVVLLFLFPATGWEIAMGQTDLLLLGALLFAVLLLESQAPFLAGILLCLLWIKPQVGLPFALAVIAVYPSRRILIMGFICGTAGLFLPVLLFSRALFFDFLRADISFSHHVGGFTNLASLLAYAEPIAGSSTFVASILRAAIFVFGFALFAVCLLLVFRDTSSAGGQKVMQPDRAHDDPLVFPATERLGRLLLLGALWFLVSPYVYPNDELLLFPVFLLVMVRQPILLGRFRSAILALEAWLCMITVPSLFWWATWAQVGTVVAVAFLWQFLPRWPRSASVKGTAGSL